MRKNKLRKKIIDTANRKFIKYQKNLTCEFPNCNEKAILSHTISKSELRKISSPDNEVIGPQQNFMRAIRFETLYEQFDNFQSIGVGVASTHKAFCSNHDSDLFECIEKGNVINPKQKSHELALFLRAFCSEYFQQKEAINFRRFVKLENAANSCIDYSDNYELRRIQYFNYTLIPLFENLLRGEANFYSETVKFEEKLPYICSALLPLSSSNDQNSFFSINVYIQNNNNSEVLFTVLESKKDELIELLASIINLKDFIFKCAFQNSSNAYLSPEWWKKQTQTKRQSIENMNLNIVKDVLL